MTVNLTDPIFSDEAKAREWFEQIRWPNGPQERFDNLPVDSIQMLKEGSGTAVTSDTRKPS